MDNLQAKQMLKQIDCHGIPRGFNGGYSELYKYCLESINKLEKIEQIINETNRRESVLVKPVSKITVRSMGFDKIREILEQE